MYACEICGAELRTRQGYRGHQRFRHDVSAGGKRGGKTFTAHEGEVVQVASGEVVQVASCKEGLGIGEAMNLACSQQILEALIRIEALLAKEGAR